MGAGTGGRRTDEILLSKGSERVLKNYLSAFYLLNEWMTFNQTRINISLGVRGEGGQKN